MTQLLVVDDDQDYAGAIRMVLQSRGFDVAMEYDPDKALERIEQRQPDAVILDVMFPEDDFAGFELARAMHARPSLSRIPILMLTAVNVHHGLGLDTLDIDNSFLPVADFLDKPVDLQELVSKVDGLVGVVKA